MSAALGTCERCAKRPATMQVTQVVQNESRQLRLCETCAADLGFAAPGLPASFPLGDFLAQLGEPPVRASDGGDPACAFCRLTLTEFRETGRLGCPHCYSSFDAHLRGLFRRVHGAVQHTGKVYLPPDPTLGERTRRLEGLRRRLERAIDAEDFERAALLRDQIRSLETAEGEGETT